MNLTLKTAILIASMNPQQAYTQEPYDLTLTGQVIVQECNHETESTCFTIQGRRFSVPLQGVYRAGKIIPVHFTFSCTYDEECKLISVTD